MSLIAKSLTELAWSAIGGNKNAVDSVSFVSTSGGLSSTYPVTDFACGDCNGGAVRPGTAGKVLWQTSTGDG